MLNKINLGNKYVIKGDAGTGKTYLGVLIGKKLSAEIKTSQKILYLTFSKLAKWQIINCVLKLRKNNLLNKDELMQLEIHNFHSLWWKLLNDYRFFLGIKKKPTILMESELIEFAEECLKEISIDIIPKSLKNKKRDLLRIFQGLGLIFLKWNPSHFGKLGKDFINANNFLTEVGRLIIERNKEGNFSHTETIYWIYELLDKNRNALNLMRYRYPVVIIDEFQDTDICQWEIIKKINPYTIIIFADNKQTIHLWRGASDSRVEEFSEHFNVSNDNAFELTKNYRFITKDNKSPKIEWDNIKIQKGGNIRKYLNYAKKKVKEKCKRIAKKAFDNNISCAILCKTNRIADEITRFFRESNEIPSLDCERLGRENSPFEKAREILIKIIYYLNDESKCIEYIENEIFFEILPENQKCSEKSKIEYLLKRHNDCIYVYDLLLKDFSKGILYLVKVIKEYAEFKGFKSNKSILDCLTFFSKEFNRLNRKEWNQIDLENKRSIIDSIILKYENKILSSPSKSLIYIMTAHQSKSREFDWVIIPWFSSIPWNMNEFAWDCRIEQDRNLFHTSHTRARKRFIVFRIIKPSSQLKLTDKLKTDKNKSNDIQKKINDFFMI
ncbi:MAG: UvrD-helicase domain-containing protein [Promethearchaeia archaeon]